MADLDIDRKLKSVIATGVDLKAGGAALTYTAATGVTALVTAAVFELEQGAGTNLDMALEFVRSGNVIEIDAFGNTPVDFYPRIALEPGDAIRWFVKSPATDAGAVTGAFLISIEERGPN